MITILQDIAIFALLVTAIIAPIISLLFLLIKRSSFRKTWVISSSVLIGIFITIMVPVLIINHFEDKSHVEELNAIYEELDEDVLANGSSTEKVLAKVYQNGDFRRRTSSPLVVGVFKNFNEESFTGILTVTVTEGGEVIGEAGFEIKLAAHEEGSDYITPKKLNLTRKNWGDVDVTYDIQGTFE